MKPAPFEYVSPRDIDAALDLLREHGDEAKPMAGGQSLAPLLNMRLSRPAIVVDLARIPDLAGAAVEADQSLRVRCLTRHRQLETDATIAARSPLLAQAAPFIGHRAIRNRGTIGGSLAHADPAGELPAAVVALDAQLVVQRSGGRRTLPARSFFEGYYTTIMDADELLTDVIIPPLPRRTGTAWAEFAPRHGDYGYVGVAAVVSVDHDGRCTAAHAAFSGVASIPHLAESAAQLVGSDCAAHDLAEVCATIAREIEPAGDLGVSSGYKRRLMTKLGAQCLRTAYERAVAS